VINVDVAKLDLDVRAKIHAGELDEAEAIVRKALKRGRKHARLHYLLALLVAKRDPAEGADAIEQSLELDGLSADARMLQLKLANDSRDEARMAAAAEAAVLALPDSGRVLAAAAKALFKIRHYTSAMRAWRLAATLAPDDATPLIGLLRAFAAASNTSRIDQTPPEASANLTALQDLDFVSEAMERLSMLDPAAAVGFLRYLPADQVDIAALALANAREADVIEANSFAMARTVRALHQRADQAFGEGDHVTAARDYRMILRLAPDDNKAAARLHRGVSSLIAAGNQLYSDGDFAGATKQFETALTFDGGNAKALRWLALSEERAGAFERAADIWRRYAEVSLDSEGWTHALAAASKAEPSPWKLEIFAAARPHLASDSARIRQGNGIASVLTRAILASLDTVSLDEAMRAFDALRRWDPALPVVDILRRRLRGFLSSALAKSRGNGTSEDGTRLAQMLVEVDPANGPALQSLGRAYLRRRDAGKALAIYQKLAELHPDRAAYRSRMDACLAQIGGRRQPVA
jgi:tetratricopeptide (TPR) repeat protein